MSGTTDQFGTLPDSVDAPPRGGAAVTPGDGVVLTHTTKALWVGSTGNVVVKMADGAVLTLTSVPSGQWLPIRVKRVMTGTTASNIVAFW